MSIVHKIMESFFLKRWICHFESRQDNLRTVLDKMQQIGIDAAEAGSSPRI